MIGTHQRVLEAIEKNVPIHYLCVHFEMAHHYFHKAVRIYGLKPRQYKNGKIHQEAITPQGALIRFRALNHRTYEDLLGFSGCVLMHPDVIANLMNPQYNYKNVQEIMIQCNMRTGPWQD